MNAKAVIVIKDYAGAYLMHHGVEGQRWGHKNGPPYPLERLVGSGEKLERLNNGKVKVVEKGSSGLSGSKAVSKQLKKEGKLPKNATSQNLDKWGKSKDKNILYISGISGSGKSTTASKFKDENTEVINLDDFLLTGTSEKDNKSKDFVNFLEKNKSEYKKLSLGEGQITVNDWLKTCKKFDREIDKYGVDAFDRNKKVIVEGTQLLDNIIKPDKSFFSDKPFILLNTNAITSIKRANKRDERNFKFNNLKNIAIWSKEIRDFKSKNNLKHSEEEFLAHHGVEGQRWGKRNGPPYPLERKAGDGEKVVRTDNGGVKVVSKGENPRIKKTKNKISQNVSDFDNAESLGLNRLEWYCKKSNEASVALAKSCGFKIDKSLSDDEWYTLALNLNEDNDIKHAEALINNLKLNQNYLMHHGVLGQEWGKRHGPPYPLDYHISTGKALKGTSETKFGGRDIEPSVSKPKRPINRDVRRCNAVPNNNNNCTYCCMAYELHRRGLGKYKATKDVNEGLTTEEIYNAYSTKFNEKDISYPSDTIFEDKNANVRELTFRDHSYKVYDADNLGNFLNNKYKEDARGVLLCPWASARAYGVESGHCISWELTNGKLTLIDPQENSVIKNPNRFLEAVECYDLVELRTDDKTISSKYLKKGGVR